MITYITYVITIKPLESRVDDVDVDARLRKIKKSLDD